MRPAITVAILCAAALTQTFAQPAGTGVIAGTVVDDTSGDPVRKAIVTVTWHGNPRSWATARTDSSGKFRFDGLPAGSFDLKAAKNGGVAVYGANSTRESGENITLADGETRDGLKLRFIHYSSISGHVFESAGTPAAGATVSLFRISRNLGQRVLVSAASANTNDRGEYHISQARPGRYYLYAAAQNQNQNSVEQRTPPPEILAGQFYGGATDSKDAALLSVKDGDVLRGMDFLLTAQPAIHITGHITGIPEPQITEIDSSGPGPRRGVRMFTAGFVQVLITPVSDVANRFASGAGTAAPDYAFTSAWLTPGQYRVSAEITVDGKLYAASQLVDAGSDSPDVTLALAPGTDIKGHFHVEGSVDSKTKFTVTLAQPGRPMMRATPDAKPGSGQPAPDGSFVIPDIVPGEFILNVNPMPPNAFLKTVQYGDQDVLLKPIEIKGGSDAALNVVISTRAAKIHGEIDAEGSDTAHAAILLAPVGKFKEYARFYYSAVADDHGKFKRAGIAPGKYKVCAVEKLAPEGFRDPEAFDQIEALFPDFLEEIEITEDADVEFHPKMIPMERAREILP